MKDIPIAFIDDETLYESENFVDFKLKGKDKEIERLNNVIDDKKEEIERLQHNQEVSTKWEIKLTQKNTKLIEENKKLKSIIKEVREYIEELLKEEFEITNTDSFYYGEKLQRDYFNASELEKVLEILDKAEENK